MYDVFHFDKQLSGINPEKCFIYEVYYFEQSL